MMEAINIMLCLFYNKQAKTSEENSCGFFHIVYASLPIPIAKVVGYSLIRLTVPIQARAL